MKAKNISGIFICLIILSNCTSISKPLEARPKQEKHSLLRADQGGWRIEHTSAYYQFFNQVHANYDLLLEQTEDPEEIRRLYIERDLIVARERLKYMADEELVSQVIGQSKSKYGTNATGHIFRLNDVYAVPRQRFTPPYPEDYTFEKLNPRLGPKYTDAITAIIQFDLQLKERGVQLIVVPVPNSSQVYAHQLHENIRLEEVIWRPWAHMIVKLLEYDVEVLDLLDLYKTYSGDNTVLNYIDHHWGMAGLDIVGQELARRFKRIPFDPKDYIDRAEITRRPIQVPMPALIPYWDKLPEGWIRTEMGIPSKYDTEQIRYKGKNIYPVANSQKSPVLIMGDSFIPHLAEESAGIYAHLAYHTGIIPAAISRDAGAAKPPEWYRQSVAGNEVEPKVVIWQIYGSAFSERNDQNDWKVVNMPAPVSPASGRASALEGEHKDTAITRKPNWVNAKVVGLTPIPELKTMSSYPDALYAYQIEVLESVSGSLKSGQRLLVYSQFLKDYQLIEKNILSLGQNYTFYLEELAAVQAVDRRIATMQLLDSLDDYESPVFFARFISNTSTSER